MVERNTYGEVLVSVRLSVYHRQYYYFLIAIYAVTISSCQELLYFSKRCYRNSLKTYVSAAL